MGPAKTCGDHVPLLHSLRLSEQRGGRIFPQNRGALRAESRCRARLALGVVLSLRAEEALKTERCGEGELREFCLPRQGGVTVALILKTERKEERLSERRGSLEVSKQRRSLKTEMEGREALNTERLPRGACWLGGEELLTATARARRVSRSGLEGALEGRRAPIDNREVPRRRKCLAVSWDRHWRNGPLKVGWGRHPL